MDKRKRFTSSLDAITEDGILCLIISSLPLRDAVRTCVLSSRWRYIWTHRPNLNFDVQNIFDPHTLRFIDPRIRDQVLREKTEQFIATVNSVIQQCQGSAGLHEFRVKYYLHGVHSHHIDVWIGFVVASQIKKLTLKLQPSNHPDAPFDPVPYHFPCQLLESSSIENLNFAFCSLTQHHGFDGFRRIKILKLNGVNVTEENLKCILSNCFALERLKLANCMQLVSLCSDLPLSRLEDLWLGGCDNLRKIDFGAINLTSLRYWGDPMNFTFKESTQITTANISFVTNKGFALNKLVKSFPRLNYLNLFVMSSSKLPPFFVNKSIRLDCLKHLYWSVSYPMESEKGHVCLASFLTVAPFMEKLTLHFTPSLSYLRPRILKQAKWRMSCPHTHLKTIEIREFTGDKWQTKFAVFLLNNTTELESMTIQRAVMERKQQKLYEEDKKIWELTLKYLRREEDKKRWEGNLKYLRQEVPANTKLLIL